MNTIKICSKLKETTYFVNIFGHEGEPLNPETDYSVGSAVAINDKGDLLTAAHVIDPRLSLRKPPWSKIKEDLIDPNTIILAMNNHAKLPKLNQYRLFGGITWLTTPSVKEPLLIDLAILRPLEPQSNIPYLKIRKNPTLLGTKVLIAGFPDDMELPFKLAYNYEPNFEIPEVNKIHDQRLRIAKKLLMIKSGMIGSQNHATLTDGNLTLEGEVFYIDNELHSGASGGPVVNTNLEVVGILTERAITSMSTDDTPRLKIPSGSSVAFSPRFIQHKLDKLND